MAEYNYSPDEGNPGDIWSDFVSHLKNIRQAKKEMSDEINLDNPAGYRYMAEVKDPNYRNYGEYKANSYPDNPNLRLPRQMDPAFAEEAFWTAKERVANGEDITQSPEQVKKIWKKRLDAFNRQKEIVSLRGSNPEANAMATKIEQLTRDYKQAQANVLKNHNMPGGPSAKERAFWLSGELEWAMSDWNKKLPKWGIGSIAERPKGGYLLSGALPTGLSVAPFVGMISRANSKGGAFAADAEGNVDSYYPSEITNIDGQNYTTSSLENMLRYHPDNALNYPEITNAMRADAYKRYRESNNQKFTDEEHMRLDPEYYPSNF